MVKLTPDVKASTIIESILSMVIILFCMGFSAYFFVNILKGDDRAREFYGSALLKAEAYKTKAEKVFIDRTTVLENFILEEKFDIVIDKPDLLILSMKLKGIDGKEVATHFEIVVLE